jgi:hypothetical protein
MKQGNHLAQITKRLKTSSAVVPALLLSLICTPIGSIGAKFSPYPLNLIFVILAVSPPLLTVLQIAFFTIWDRDRLHNEDHVERKMLITQTKPEMGDGHRVIEMTPNSELVENPSVSAGES